MFPAANKNVFKLPAGTDALLDMIEKREKQGVLRGWSPRLDWIVIFLGGTLLFVTSQRASKTAF